MKLTVLQSIRTNNFNDQQMAEKFTNMWSEASRLIRNKDSITYGVYYGYDSNYKGDYSVSVAVEDMEGDEFIELPVKGKYKIFQVDTNNEQGIYHTWSEIWEEEEAGLLKRAYSYDYEKYYPNGKIEIYIAEK
jgi:predicted transcriptional regulator YdeE